MDKKRIEGRWAETSWHNTAKSLGLTPGGKCDGCAQKRRVLTWGDPAAGGRGVSRDRSSGPTSRGRSLARLN